MKQCPNCRGNLADFVAVCPYCGVSMPVVQIPQPVGGWAVPPKNSGKAVASLVCSVVFFCWPFTAIAGVILGHLALGDIKRSAGRITGNALAVAGLVIGYLGLAGSTLFTLAIILAVRNNLRTNVPANEIAAVATMRVYDSALKTYVNKCPQQGYPASLVALGPGPGNCTRANLVASDLAMTNPVKFGYRFEYHSGSSVFVLVAKPILPGRTGARYFYVDESGVLRQAGNQIIGPRSDPVENPDDTDDDDDKSDDSKK